MAQREKEETELKVPETLSSCVNNCGRSGNPATTHMCQSCFQATLAPNPPTCSAHESLRSDCLRSPEASESSDLARPIQFSEAAAEQSAPVRAVNRCSGCRKKVGLTGFMCRCGDLFCAEHRYSDRHACSFDYKAAGREAIARENPVVKSAKIVRI